MPARRGHRAGLRGFSRAMMLLALTGLVGACSGGGTMHEMKALPLEKVVSPLAPPAADEPPRLGIAFGGGGVRGFAHLGVLRALEEAGIRARVVSGTSVGALAAALYASGVPHEGIEKAIATVDEIGLFDLVLSRDGLLGGKALGDWVRTTTGTTRIESLPIPLAIAVTELASGQPLVLVSGDLGAAVQASASVPGAIIPVRSGEDTLIDGGILTVVPVRAARALGAEVVVAVDIYCGPAGPLKHHAVNTIFRATRLQSCLLSDEEIREADILIRPAFEPDNAIRFSQREQAAEAGYLAAKAQIPAIKDLLGRRAHRPGLPCSGDPQPDTRCRR